MKDRFEGIFESATIFIFRVCGTRGLDYPKVNKVMAELKLLERKALRISPEDNVAVALTTLKAGDQIGVDGRAYTIQSSVPAKH